MRGFPNTMLQTGLWNRKQGSSCFPLESVIWIPQALEPRHVHFNKQVPNLLGKGEMDTRTTLLINTSLLWGYYSLLCTLAGIEHGN